MDDYLVISKTKEDNKILFDELNRLHTMISFTSKIQENNELPIMEILIEKQEFLNYNRKKNLVYRSIPELSFVL